MTGPPRDSAPLWSFRSLESCRLQGLGVRRTRTFIVRLCEIDGTRSIIQAMISMAKALDTQVVAEGVEREEQMEVLKEMGCDFLQGFLLSRPIPPLAIPELLNGGHPLLAAPRGFSQAVEEYSGA